MSDQPDRPDLSGYGQSTPPAVPARPGAGPPAEDERHPIDSPAGRRPRRRGPARQADLVQINTKISGAIRDELDQLVDASAAPAWPGGPVQPATMRAVIEEAIHRLYVHRIEEGDAAPQ